ncbi:hypothetical protein O181_046648 [Austropuccinia psidii MF-1]|uniref:DASH complex subunit DAM1 n=1 Tax=Austropuccinia psidii MF-1 TaxID=1389203 RepID=A0A9Q3HIR7_9BASI|nr:hypothetical protein [Austropuccinia psidii MF-1]
MNDDHHHQSKRQKRNTQAPKTPLKRVSRNSLRSQALSTNSSKNSPVIDQLATIFKDLDQSFTTLVRNIADLNDISNTLNSFNEAFASFLFGLRVNVYLNDFNEAPRSSSFKKFHQQIETENLINVEPGATNELKNTTKPAETIPKQDQTSSQQEEKQPQQRKKTVNKQLAKAQLKKSIQPILNQLPLKYKEDLTHKAEMESVLIQLKSNQINNGDQAVGLSLNQLQVLEPHLKLHRIRDCVTTLTLAKKVIKFNNPNLSNSHPHKDAVLYKLKD